MIVQFKQGSLVGFQEVEHAELGGQSQKSNHFIILSY